MQGKNHVALALAVPLAGAALTGGPLPASAAAWAGLLIGALAPDIDGGGSVAYWGNFLPRPITPGPIRALLNGVGTTVSGVVRSIFGHRNTLHWPLIGVALAGLGWYVSLDWLLWFGAGYVLHILGDALTKSGVPLLGPLWTGDISFSPMKTGGPAEAVLGIGLWAFVSYEMWQQFNGPVLQFIYGLQVW